MGNTRAALKIFRSGEWKTWSYSDYYNDITCVANAFVHLGLENMHSVCIMGSNCPEWFFADLGAIFAGGVACGIYANSSKDTIQYILEDSR